VTQLEQKSLKQIMQCFEGQTDNEQQIKIVQEWNSLHLVILREYDEVVYNGILLNSLFVLQLKDNFVFSYHYSKFNLVVKR